MRSKERITLEQLQLLVEEKKPTPEKMSNQLKGLFTRYGVMKKTYDKFEQDLEDLKLAMMKQGLPVEQNEKPPGLPEGRQYAP